MSWRVQARPAASVAIFPMAKPAECGMTPRLSAISSIAAIGSASEPGPKTAGIV